MKNYFVYYVFLDDDEILLFYFQNKDWSVHKNQFKIKG
jgi:hypothetical protein